MSRSDAKPPTASQCWQRVAALETELAQSRSQIVTLQQECDRLRQSEYRYRQVFENAPISMQFIGADGCLVEANRAFDRFYGVQFEQWQQNYNIFTDPQLVENGTLQYMQQAFAGEAVIEPPTYYDITARDEAGNSTLGQGCYFPVRDRAGVTGEIIEIAMQKLRF
jgi:PAS domain S-box-containing protein